MQAPMFSPGATAASASCPVNRTCKTGLRQPVRQGMAETNREPQVKSFAKSLEDAAQKTSVAPKGANPEGVKDHRAAEGEREQTVTVTTSPSFDPYAGAALTEWLAALLKDLGLTGSNATLTGSEALRSDDLSLKSLFSQEQLGMAEPEIKPVLIKLLEQLRQGGKPAMEADTFRELEQFLQQGCELPAAEFNAKLADILKKVAPKALNDLETLSGKHNGGVQTAIGGGESGIFGGTQAQNSGGKGSTAAAAGGEKVAAAVEKAVHNIRRDSDSSKIPAESIRLEDAGEKSRGNTGSNAFHKPEAAGEKVVTDKAEAGKGAGAHDLTRPENVPNDWLTRMSYNPVKDAGNAHSFHARLPNVIFGQIVQKAKLVEFPGMAELQIKLKPDFLGKLNLSITSENGIITAKLSAESYRVKEVIEANLSILRDALAEQGVKVDQLVVDVGTQTDYGGLREREAASYSRPSNRRGGVMVAGDDEARSLFEQTPLRGAGGDLYGSTVDFIA